MGNGCTSHKAVQITEARSLPPLKIVFVGDIATGKTSIIERYNASRFKNDDYTPTSIVNIVSVVRKVNVPDQGIATLALWDTPGHEDVDMRKTYYLNADAIVVVVDISDPDSFDTALTWKKDISDNVKHTVTKDIKPDPTESNPTQRVEHFKPKAGAVPVLLLGNKFDLAKENYLREQYSSYDVLSSKVTFDPNVKRNSFVEYDNIDSPRVEENLATKVSPDAEVDQGIVADNNESDEVPQHPEEVRKKSVEEDQGIVADKDDVTNDPIVENQRNSPQEKGKSSKHKEEQPTSSNAGNEPEKSQSASNENNIDTSHPIDNGTKDNNALLSDEVINNEESTSSDKTKESENSSSSENQAEKKSVDSGVENSSPSQSSNESSQSQDLEQEHKPKKLKKLFPKDLIEQNNESTEKQIDPSTEMQPENTATNSGTEIDSTHPQANEGSIITMTTLSTLPPCVDVLETFADEHGFIAGIPVSAKDAKGGVHEALQSLVRHLVTKMKQNSPNQHRRIDEISMRSQLSATRRHRRQPRNMSSMDFEPLQEVGIVEIDEMLRKCNPSLQHAEELTSGYRESLHDFKRACYKRHLVAGSRISIEECISAMKEAIQAPPNTSNEKSDIRATLLMQEYRPSFFLSAIDEDNFINLQVVDGNSDVIDTDVDREKLFITKDALAVLDIYQDKVFKSCSHVVESGFELEQVLSQYCDQLSSQEEKAWDMAVAAGHSQSTVRRILAGLAQDKARLRGTLEQIKETRRSVNAVRARVRAALLF